MKIGKKNHIPTSILELNGCLCGESGIGKSTTVFKMFQKLAGDDGYLFASCGKEDGLKALEGVNYVTCDSWNDDYSPNDNTIGFATLVDQIVDSKNEDFPELKILVIDTIDELRASVEAEVIRLHNKQYPDKRATSIKQCFGGFMAGDDMANRLILDKLWELKKVGVNFFLIAHSKFKDQTDIATGETFAVLGSNMSNRDFNAFKTKLDYLGVAYIDRTIVREKSRGEGKSKKAIGTITSEARKVAFRSDNISIDSKSRLADIVSEVPLDSDAIIDAIEDALKIAIEKAGGSLEDRKKEDAERLAKRTEEIAIAEQRHKEQKQLDNMIEDLKSWIKENKAGGTDKVKALVTKAKEMGVENPIQVSDINDATMLLEYAHSL